MSGSYIHNLFYNCSVYQEIFDDTVTMREIGIFPLLTFVVIESFFIRTRKNKSLKNTFLKSLIQLLIMIALLWFTNSKQNLNAAVFFSVFSFISLLIFTATRWLVNKGYIK